MLTINATDMIGKGLHRECYSHPQDQNLCIKIAVNENVKETRREQKYYRLLKKRQICWDMLPKYYGNMDTNLGSGAVFEMIRNHDGSVSKTLEFYLKSIQQTERCYSGLASAFFALKKYLLNEQIITMTIKPKNVLYQEINDDAGKLIIVDNIGNSDYIPIANYSKTLGDRKIKRKWYRFEDAILKAYPDNAAFRNIIKSGT